MKSLSNLKLDSPIADLVNVGPITSKKLAKLEIKTISDLLNHYPFRYNDYSLISKIAMVQPGETVTITGIIKKVENIFTKSGKRIQQAEINDGSGEINAVWFNQMFITKNLHENDKISLSGKVDWFGKKLVLLSPEYELVNHLTDNNQHLTIHTGRLVPVYPETYGITSKWLRSRTYFILKNLSNQIVDYLPEKIRTDNNLLDLKTALFQIHFPDNQKMADLAKVRLAFDELYLIQLTSLLRKKSWGKLTVDHKFNVGHFQLQINGFINNLPFKLTNAQNRVIQEILVDLALEKPMNRLLEGDVGSGKTVVAAIAMYLAYLNGFQSALMCPTEILAEQHFKTVSKLLGPLGVKIALQTGSKKVIKNNCDNYDIIIGTHALLTETVKFKKLGLIIIDEQHRFGVGQRGILREKGNNPHVLTMTATPIPRTLALTLYGDLDLSVIDEMPAERIPIKTWVVPPEKREKAYTWIESRIKNHELTKEQVFIVCPLIEESETLKTARAATIEFEKLKKNVFKDLRLGLLHGRLKPKEKNQILDDFRSGKLDILVSTPVVEVGIDIPQATIILIEASERFGLAQLHQLRGRVGRGKQQSYCLLFTDIYEYPVIRRLKAMETMQIGPNLAEYDLKLRGPGEVYGLKQHGLPDLRIASLTDSVLIDKAKKAAEDTINTNSSLNIFPLLKEKLKNYKIEEVKPD